METPGKEKDEKGPDEAGPVETTEALGPPPGYEDAPRFIPPIKTGYVVRVYDGDTITVVASLMEVAYEFSVRVRGVDCPEMRTRDPDEKHVAIVARDAVRAVALERWVALADTAMDKYGRLLATVSTPEGVNLTEMLIEQRLAVAYGGRTKNVPANWRTYHESEEPEDGDPE
jgi:micrococcal nuclease